MLYSLFYQISYLRRFLIDPPGPTNGITTTRNELKSLMTVVEDEPKEWTAVARQGEVAWDLSEGYAECNTRECGNKPVGVIAHRMECRIIELALVSLCGKCLEASKATILNINIAQRRA